MARIEECIAGEESWWAYALDVLGHTGLGTAYALVPVAACVWLGWGTGWAMISGVVFALTGGVVREVVQYKKSGKPHLLDRSLDALQHILGAPLALGFMFIVRSL